MATIMAKGSQATVTLILSDPDDDGDAYWTLSCDRGAWCTVHQIEPKTVWNRDEALEYADMHADSWHG